MALLDARLELPDYDLVLKHHSQRPPSQRVQTNFGESLVYARTLVQKTRYKLEEYALAGQNVPSDVLAEAMQYHFDLDLGDDQHQQDKAAVLTRLRQTEQGLQKRLVIADVLHSTGWNEYAYYHDQRNEQRVLPGPSRPNLMPGEEGYVAPSKHDAHLPMNQRELKSIHIEFSLAEIYPAIQIARLIIHEATHKFARTEDKAYTTTQFVYESLSRDDRIINADSYAYLCVSIGLKRLVKTYEELFRTTNPLPPPPIPTSGGMTCVIL